MVDEVAGGLGGGDGMLVMVLTAGDGGCVRDEDANGPVGGSGDGGNVWVLQGRREVVAMELGAVVLEESACSFL